MGMGLRTNIDMKNVVILSSLGSEVYNNERRREGRVSYLPIKKKYFLVDEGGCDPLKTHHKPRRWFVAKTFFIFLGTFTSIAHFFHICISIRGNG